MNCSPWFWYMGSLPSCCRQVWRGRMWWPYDSKSKWHFDPRRQRCLEKAKTLKSVVCVIHGNSILFLSRWSFLVKLIIRVSTRNGPLCHSFFFLPKMKLSCLHPITNKSSFFLGLHNKSGSGSVGLPTTQRERKITSHKENPQLAERQRTVWNSA